MLGGHNPNISLLPDNPSAQIMPVQGGGGNRGWQLIPINIPGDSENKDIYATRGELAKYRSLWKRTLGPNIPSRRKPRADPHILIGEINSSECSVFVVAPLRGDMESAKRIFPWVNDTVSNDSNAHIVFMDPIEMKGDSHIRKQIETLEAKYPGQILTVVEENSDLQGLDGLLLTAVPETSQQIFLGKMPNFDDVYHKSSRKLGCMTINTLRVPVHSTIVNEMNNSIHSLHFEKAYTFYDPEKESSAQFIHTNKVLKAPAGWVAKLTYSTMDGGAPRKKKEVVPAPAPPPESASASLSESATPAPTATPDSVPAPESATPAPTVTPDSVPAPESVPASLPESVTPAPTPAPAPAPAPALATTPAPATTPSTTPAPATTPSTTSAPATTPSTTSAQNQQSSGPSIIDVVLSNEKYKIRNPNTASSDWEKGQFSDAERSLLENQGFLYPYKVYAAYLKGAAQKNCNSEENTMLNPDCGIFRYLMAKQQYDRVSKINSAKTPVPAPAPVVAPAPAPVVAPASAPASASASASASAPIALRPNDSKKGGTRRKRILRNKSPKNRKTKTEKKYKSSLKKTKTKKNK